VSGETLSFSGKQENSSDFSQPAKPERLSRIEKLLVSAIGLCLAMQAILIFTQEINWDEFYFLSFIYEHQRGELTKALQTFHVHFFGWLPTVGGSEIRQIEAARLVMLAFETGTMICIYWLARVFVPRKVALLSVLAYVTAGFVLLHGASFRADSVAAFLMMVSLVMIARSPWRTINLLLIALLIAIAGLVTVKVAFYAPAIIGIGLWRVSSSSRRHADLFKLAICGVGAVLIFGLLYWLHQSALPQADLGTSEAMMSSAAKTTILQSEFFPRRVDVIRGAAMALVPSFLLIGGIVAALSAFVSGSEQRFKMAALLCLAAPLFSFLFYRNAYPYYFGFIFPPAMVLVGWMAHRMKLSNRIISILIAVMLLPSLLLFGRTVRDGRAAQTQLTETVHRIFPQPVATIDRNNMIASFPKRGFFMSSWGLQNYKQAAKPVFAEILQSDIVPLLVLNSPTLEEAVGEQISTPLRTKLLPEDRATLSENYITHWGKIWVAGQKYRLSSVPKTISIAIPGVYTIEAASPVNIDDKVLANGSVIKLGRGEHDLSSPVKQTVILRWGVRLYRPAYDPVAQPIYRGF